MNLYPPNTNPSFHQINGMIRAYAPHGGFHTARTGANIFQLKSSDNQPDIAKSDWDLLFTATTARLIAIAHEEQRAGLKHLAIDQTDIGGMRDRFAAEVLECVDALGQLQATIRYELNRAKKVPPHSQI